VPTHARTVLARIEDGVGVITFNSPATRNSLGDDFTPFLRATIRQFATDDRVGCVLLTGAGSAFCSGGNVKAMAGADDSSNAVPPNLTRTTWTGLPDGSSTGEGSDQYTKQATLSGALFHMEKPTIAALPGAAAGAGFSIALACDLRVGAESAFVTTAFRGVALPGDYGASWLLPQLVGVAKAKQLFFTAERVPSAECHRLGIFQEVYPDASLHAQALDLARSIAGGPRYAMAASKRNLNDAVSGIGFKEGLDNEARRMAEVLGTPGARAHFQEATRAFVEKREPDFSS
jgi:enoyl-CoA hydratase/carnithine racemase